MCFIFHIAQLRCEECFIWLCFFSLHLAVDKYVAAAEGVSSSVDKLNWWKNHERDLPNWSSSC